MKEFDLVVAEAANDGREAMMSRVAATSGPAPTAERRAAPGGGDGRAQERTKGRAKPA